MRRIKDTAMIPYDAEFVNGEEILIPIKLAPKDVESRTIELLGFKFIDTGYALACPDCGKISGISCREDLDKKIDWFLKFGCACYKKSTKDSKK